MSVDISKFSESFVQVLKENPALVFTDSGRVKCTLTNHEMPCKEEIVRQHISAKKYKRVCKGVTKPYFLDDYKPHLEVTEEKGHTHQLVCNLTGRFVNNQPDHVLRHVKGKKFLRAKERWLECQKTGKKFLPAFLMAHTKAQDEEELPFADDEKDEEVESMEAEEENEGEEETVEDDQEKVEENDADEPTVNGKEEKKTPTQSNRKRRKNFRHKRNSNSKKAKKEKLIVF